MLNYVCQVLPWCEDLLLLLDLQVALALTCNSPFFTDGRFNGEIPPKGEILGWKLGKKNSIKNNIATTAWIIWKLPTRLVTATIRRRSVAATQKRVATMWLNTWVDHTDWQIEDNECVQIPSSHPRKKCNKKPKKKCHEVPEQVIYFFMSIISNF